MSETQLLVGSLSNDLFRVAALAQRGSDKAAERFLVEAKRWARELRHKKVAEYIRDIARDVCADDANLTEARAERCLMYGVLLQNYALKAQI